MPAFGANADQSGRAIATKQHAAVNARGGPLRQRLLRDAVEPVVRQSGAELLPHTSGWRFGVKDDRKRGQLRTVTFRAKLVLHSKLHIALTADSARLDDARIDQGYVRSVYSELKLVRQP